VRSGGHIGVQSTFFFAFDLIDVSRNKMCLETAFLASES